MWLDWWRVLRPDRNASLETVFNWHRRITFAWGDFVVGEPPSYASESDPDALGDLVTRTRLTGVVREMVQDMSRFGDGLCKVRLEDGEARPEAVSPEIWFPVVARDNVRRVRHHVLAWVFDVPADGFFASRSGRDRYLRAEIHGDGRIEHRLHRLNGAQIGHRVTDDAARRFFDDWDDEPEALDTPLVIHAPNRRASDRLFGFDDYADVNGPIRSYEGRYAQVERILDKHADPAMAGPRIQTELDPATGLPVPRGPADKYFVVEQEGQAPSYVVWNPQLDAAFRQMDEAMKQIFVHSELSPVLFGMSETGYAESGTSLKLRCIKPAHKAAAMKTELDPAVREIIRVASLLEGSEIDDARIGWKDGLPDDDRERGEIEGSLVERRLTSRRSSMQRLFDHDEEAAQQEYERMLEEERGAREAQDAPGVPGAPDGSLGTAQAIVEAALGRAETNGRGTDSPAPRRIPPKFLWEPDDVRVKPQER